MRENTQLNPWSKQDEGSHYPVTREWWTFETIFLTEDKRKWNLKLILSYNLEKPNCFFQYALFDITNKTCVLRKDIDDTITKLKHQKNKLDLEYETTKVTGLYPDYSLHLDDKDQLFMFNIDFHAISDPHWIAQNITNGDLPFGLNFYKYGFIPNTNINGSMKVNDQHFKVNGKGYIEHVWGDWSYQKPLSKITNLRKTVTTYANLGKWWLYHHHPRIPTSLAFTTENNLFGYDWAWGVFDNDWSVFYGNILFWLYQGPAFGILTLTPDGKTYWDFSDIDYKYNNVHYVNEYDIYFASDIDLTARLHDKNIHLNFTLTTECHDYIDPFNHQGFYKAFILSEMPGIVTGIYKDKNQEIELKGDCKMMPLRQPSILGHNALAFHITKPPKGIGIDFDLNSHYLKKQIRSSFHLVPRPKISFRMKKLDTQDFTF
jgi:hypothetical protein